MRATGRGAPDLSCEMVSDLCAVAPTVERVVAGCLAELPPGPRAEEAGDALRLALTEAVNNCIQHGYAGVPGELIGIELWRRTGRVTLRVYDRGHPLPRRLVEAPPRAPDPQALPEAGWGWLLIRRSVDRVTYERRDGWNRLTLERRL
jgi:serine/threonine-protein kinase RsbW